MDCNWVYDSEKNAFKCVKQNCKWEFNQEECDWECKTVCPVVPDIPDESEEVPDEGKKNCSCEDIDARLTVIETTLGIDNETIANKSYGEAIDKVNKDVVDLYDWIHDIYSWLEVAFNDIEGLKNKTEGFDNKADIVKDVKDDIKENGLFLGDKWWMGQ